LRELIDAIAACDRRPTLVGLTGPVSVGKTTIAMLLAGSLAPLRVTTVSTDGFLFPNAVLQERGLSMKKGFPESFDADALNAFLRELRSGATSLTVPLYDHLTYDVQGSTDVIVGDVVIVEGVNALLPEHVGAYDVTVYVDAPDDAIFEWFAARLTELFGQAADDPTSFYAPFSDWGPDQVREFAYSAWNGINAVNLEEHIRPARGRAQWIVEKSADHTVVEVRAARP
jgi:type I pantothenate kinase